MNEHQASEMGRSSRGSSRSKKEGFQDSERTAHQMGVAFPGTLPFDPQPVKTRDAGDPIAAKGQGGAFVEALNKGGQAIVDRL